MQTATFTFERKPARIAVTLTRLDGGVIHIADASTLDIAAAAAEQRDGETLTIEYFPE